MTDSPLDTGLKFGLERDLQHALRANLDQLENGLKAIDGGKEMQTEIGRIDITAEDKDGNIVVIELKSDIADEGSITQIQSYMGALRKIYKRTIRGILVARTFPTKVELAAQVSNITLVKYGYQFTFTTVEDD